MVTVEAVSCAKCNTMSWKFVMKGFILTRGKFRQLFVDMRVTFCITKRLVEALVKKKQRIDSLEAKLSKNNLSNLFTDKSTKKEVFCTQERIKPLPYSASTQTKRTEGNAVTQKRLDHSNCLITSFPLKAATANHSHQ